MQLDLDKYREQLNKLIKDGRIRYETASTYYYCLTRINRECMKVNEASLKKFFNKLLKNSGSEFHKYVAAIRKYENHVLKQHKGIIYGEFENEIFRKYKLSKGAYKTGGSGLSDDTIKRKINALRNEKLRLAFRTQAATGLRVSELGELKKSDIEFVDDDRIIVKVRDAKGGKRRTVESINDEYLVNKLKRYVEDIVENKLFYSTSYLKKKAGEYGFESHDLRRYYAGKKLSEKLDEGLSKKEALRAVQKNLGHEELKTTRIYLKNKS